MASEIWLTTAQKSFLPLPCSPHLLHWERWSCTKMKQDSCRVPHCAWHGLLAPFLSGGTANAPWCSEEAVPAAQPWWSLTSSQASRGEGVGHKDAGSNPCGHKSITRMQSSFCRCSPVPVSCLPYVFPCLVSAEALQKPFSNTATFYYIIFFFFIVSNFQPARDYSSETRQNPLFS